MWVLLLSGTICACSSLKIQLLHACKVRLLNLNILFTWIYCPGNITVCNRKVQCNNAVKKSTMQSKRPTMFPPSCYQFAYSREGIRYHGATNRMITVRRTYVYCMSFQNIFSKWVGDPRWVPLDFQGARHLLLEPRPGFGGRWLEGLGRRFFSDHRSTNQIIHEFG